MVDLHDGPPSLGQRAADWVSDNVGSWYFILLQTLIVAVWVILNATSYIRHWDPYPFIFMNLVFSLQAAYTASLVMISQNRQDEMARKMANNNYVVDLKTAREVRAIHDHLDAQDRIMADLCREMAEIRASNRSG
ncbi:MAG: DUF1003 domain-containing protein [Methanosarcinales archaeon]|nr:DUF1003 domain-containing protein [Methanosarcinales archaeon]